MSTITIEGTDGFDFELTYLNNGVKYCAFDVAPWFQSQIQKYPGYQIDLFLKLEVFDCTSSLLGLPQVPFPDLSGLESRAERAAIQLNHWLKYPKYGLAIYTAMKGGNWTRAGLLPIQNTGLENWQTLLTPILTANSDIFLMGTKSRIAVEIVDMGHGQLKQQDKLIFRGGFSYKLTLLKNEAVPVVGRRILGVDLVDGVATEVLAYNPHRKYLYFSNAGETNIQYVFGGIQDLTSGATIQSGKITQTNGLVLSPLGTGNYLNSQFTEIAPLSAVSIGGAGRITLIEGY